MNYRRELVTVKVKAANLLLKVKKRAIYNARNNMKG
jgi:hypothetical protein